MKIFKINNRVVDRSVDTCCSDQGYTLIEVMVALQIFIIVVSFTYTIYLFAYRYIVQWNDQNDLLAQELLLNKTLISNLGQAKQIIEIRPDQIKFIDANYNQKTISWYPDTLSINSKAMNLNAIRINILDLKFMDINGEKSFQEIDLNSDEMITFEELKYVKIINFEYELCLKKNCINNYTLIPVKDSTL